jgi:glycosyltransferase involved in cell wall biosynthesis
MVKNKNIKISVIMATMNSAETLQRAIDSFAAQDYPHKELIIIDGASTDGTVDIIKKTESIIHYWISEPDSGVYEAWNKGLDHVTGDWVHFLGSDDYYMGPDVFSRVARWLERATPQIDLFYGLVLRVSKEGEPLDMRGQPWGSIKYSKRFGLPMPHQGLFHRSSCFNRTGKFDSAFKICGDYEFTLRALRLSEPVFISDTIITTMTFGGISSNPKNAIRVLRESAKARKQNNMIPYPVKSLVFLVRLLIIKLFVAIFGSKFLTYLINIRSKVRGAPPPIYQR